MGLVDFSGSPRFLFGLFGLLAPQRLRKYLKRILGSIWVTTFVLPLIAAFPPTAAVICDEKNGLLPSWVSTPVRKWLTAHTAVAWTVVLWPVVLIGMTYWGAALKRSVIDVDTLTAKDYGLMIRTLNEVTGHRLSRLSAFIRRFAKEADSIPAADYIDVLAKPEEQIEELVWSIYHAFLDDSAADLSVTLAEMEGKRFKRFRFWLPEGHMPTSTENELCGRRCCLSIAADSKGVVIVEDIEKELEKQPNRRIFAPGAQGSSKVGSLIAYPVSGQLTNDVPFVVSVRSQTPRYFRKSRKSRYEAILEPFALRLAVEHSLSVIKKHHEHQ
jgi:hypothetical protein